MFRLNDKVRFVNENGEGIIKEIHRNRLLIENEFGFDEFYYFNEVIPAQNVINEKEITVEKQNEKADTKKTKLIENERVVDLHFTQLVDFTRGFSVQQKLQIQLKEAKNAIENARNQGIEKLILIHGKGKGKLEKEVYNLLEKEKDIEYFDADFQRYKLGAVEIRFRKK